MIRVKKTRQKYTVCVNCGHAIQILPKTVKELDVDGIIATYVECPVCGERLLKQLDTQESQELVNKIMKLELRSNEGKSLSDKEKKRLKSAKLALFNKRLQLRKNYWDEIYQSLNQED